MSAGAWIFAAIGWALIAAGAGIAAWALFGDRARGRRRCPKCWYDMGGVPGLKCPECGREAPSERNLSRTRRRWRRAAAGAALAALSYGVFVVPDVAERGARAAIPGAVLVCWPVDLSDWTDPFATPPSPRGLEAVMLEELKWRLKEHRLTGWQVSILLRRIRAAFEAGGQYGVAAADRETLDTLRRAPGLGASDDWPLEALSVRLASLGLELRVRPDAWLDKGPFEAPTLAESLDLIAGAMSCDWVPEAGGVRVVAYRDWHWEPRATTRVVIYDVGDLAPERVPCWTSQCGSSPSTGSLLQTVSGLELLVDLTTTFVEPSRWVDGGGTQGWIQILGGSLIVHAPAGMHIGIEQWLGTLRGALRRDRAAPVESPPGTRLVIRAYNIGDLQQRGPNPDPVAIKRNMQECDQQLVDSITTRIDPDEWIDAGGTRGHCCLYPFEPLLIVWASQQTQAEVEAFLAARRAAGGE